MVYLFIIFLSTNSILNSISFDEASNRVDELENSYEKLVADATNTQLELESIYEKRGIALPSGQYVKKVINSQSLKTLEKTDQLMKKDVFDDSKPGQTFDSAKQQVLESNQKNLDTWRAIYQTLSILNLKIGNPEPNDLKDFNNLISEIKSTKDLEKQNNNLQKNYTTIVRRMLPNLLKKYTKVLDQIIFETISQKSLEFSSDGQKQIHSDPNSSNKYSETDLIVVIKSWINKNLSFADTKSSRVIPPRQSSPDRISQPVSRSSSYKPSQSSQSSRRPSQSSKKTFKK